MLSFELSMQDPQLEQPYGCVQPIFFSPLLLPAPSPEVLSNLFSWGLGGEIPRVQCFVFEKRGGRSWVFGVRWLPTRTFRMALLHSVQKVTAVGFLQTDSLLMLLC